MVIKDSRILRKFAEISNRLLESILVIGVLLMLSLIFVNVVLRYGFNMGISVSDELARIFFIWVIFIGSILALRRKQHLGVNMLVDKLPIKTQKYLHIVRQLIVLSVLVLLVKGSWLEAEVGVSVYLPVTGLPQIVFSGVVLFSALGMFVVTVTDLLLAILSPACIQNKDKFLTSMTHLED